MSFEMYIDTDKIRDIYLSRTFEFTYLLPTGDPFPTKREMLDFAQGKRLANIDAKIFSTLFESAFLPEICCFVYTGEHVNDLKLVWNRNELFNSHGFMLTIRKPTSRDIVSNYLTHCYVNLKRSAVRHGLSTTEYTDLMRKLYLKLSAMRGAG